MQVRIGVAGLNDEKLEKSGERGVGSGEWGVTIFVRAIYTLKLHPQLDRIEYHILDTKKFLMSSTPASEVLLCLIRSNLKEECLFRLVS